MDKIYYSYNDCLKDCKVLLPQIELYNPDALVSIARGGLTLGHLLSQGLNTNKLYTINSIHYNNTNKLDTFEISNIPNLHQFKKVVLIDDIIDSGETMVEIKRILEKEYLYCEFKIATLFYKKDAIIEPDFMVREANQWIDFFWEVDLLK
ncbi:MAG: phosphoribosyltransferase [Arcobacteraceae bacterium]|nr:phosphoribosyltransferase [Arcobacteraceae bacterium]